MDGIHDLGGRQGFGAIDVNEPEEQFHEPWEERVRGIVNAMSRPPDWNLDWFRQCDSVMEGAMLDVMYDIPSTEGVIECVITEEAVQGRSDPIVVLSEEYKKKEA